MTYQTRVAHQLAAEPQERLLEVVVRLGRDIVVLQVLLAVESDGLGLDLALLDVDLVAAEDDGDVLADADEIAWKGGVSLAFYNDIGSAIVAERRCGRSRTVPVGNVLVGNAGRHVEHDDTALAVDVVTVTEATELLLAGGIPDIELDRAEVLRVQG